MSKESPVGASAVSDVMEKSVREMQNTARTIVAYIEWVYSTKPDPGSALLAWTVEIVGHKVGRSQSSVPDVRTACERRKRKSCRKALVQFDELVMLMTIEKPKDKDKIRNCIGIKLDHVDRSDDVVVGGTTDRVVKARFVHRVPRQQRQQTSAEIVGGEMKARVSDLWSGTFRWDVQLAGSQPRDRRKIITHRRAVKDVTLQDATVNAACVASVRVTGTVMEAREDKARWFCIRREVELAKCGFSVECEGCRVAASGDEVSRPHGKECRERIRVDTLCDDAGQERVRAAEERLAPAASAARAEVAQEGQASPARAEVGARTKRRLKRRV